MKPAEHFLHRRQNRIQHLFFYLTMTAALASGLAIYFSASTVFDLIKSATSGLFLPLLLSLILTFLLQPLVGIFERAAINRSAAILMVYLLVAAVVYLLFHFLMPHWHQTWDSLRVDLPRYSGRLVAVAKEWQDGLQDSFPFVGNYDLPLLARKKIELFFTQAIAQTPRQALRLGSLLLLVPLFTFFFLRDGHRIMRSFLGLVPNRYFEMVHDLSYLVTKQLSHFIRGRILEAAIVGLVVIAGLSLTDIRYVLFLGAFAGVTNLIPYIGPLIGMVPGILIALIDLGPGPQFWWIIIVYFLIAQVIVDNCLLIPILISRVSNLHPLWVIIAIIMGGKLYGVVGMIIGVPIASIIKIALLEVRSYRRAFALPDTLLESDRLP